jgi:hypothetical protein
MIEDQQRISVHPDEIDRLQVQIGHRFPSSYRKFLLERNGASVEGSYYVSELHGVGGTPEWDVIWNLECYEGRIPPWSLPIGQDFFGNQILLDLRPETHGQILFWDHEIDDAFDTPEAAADPEAADAARYGKLEVIFPSFEALLQHAIEAKEEESA